MAQDLNVDPIIMELKTIIEQKDKAILELKGRIDGVGTKLQFLLEKFNSNVIESRLHTVNNGYDAYELKIDKICHRLDNLENILNQHFRSS